MQTLQIICLYPIGNCRLEGVAITVEAPMWIKTVFSAARRYLLAPHASIRLALVTDEEKKAPGAFETIKAKGKGFEDLDYRIQVDTLDCLGCGNCADSCPAKEKALVMQPLETQEIQIPNWKYAVTLPIRDDIMNKETVKGSQFAMPYLEFSGACAGCGETPYIKVITQLFGDRMMIANATGCSSIWGASAPSTPYCKDADGRGPSWANSLFEDNAEYGMGMATGVRQMREKIRETMEKLLDITGYPDVRKHARHGLPALMTAPTPEHFPMQYLLLWRTRHLPTAKASW